MSASRVLRLKEVLARTGLSRSSIHRLMQRGHFPRTVRLGPRSVGWLEASIEAWFKNLDPAD
jgi:prophage regulatory protein